jgi:FG-GAP-like repeat
MFQPAVFPAIALGSLVPTADLNGEGNADLLGSISFGGIFPSGELQVVLGNGDGTFSTLAPFPENGPYAYSTAVVLADLNGDGNLDVVSLDAFSPMDRPTGALTLSHLISVY